MYLYLYYYIIYILYKEKKTIKEKKRMTHKRFTASNAAELSKQSAFFVLDEQESKNYRSIIERVMGASNGGWFSLIVWSDDELHDKLSARVISILKRDGFKVEDSYTEDEDGECAYIGKVIYWNV